MSRVVVRTAWAVGAVLVMAGVGVVSGGGRPDSGGGARMPPRPVGERAVAGAPAKVGAPPHGALRRVPAEPSVEGQPSSGGSAAAGSRVHRWRWPVTPRPDVLRPFRAPVSAYGAGHRGLDLAVIEGMPVLAVEAGRVSHAGTVAGRGTVTVEHVDGLRSTYEPVDPGVHAGEAVAVGEVIGRVAASSGRAHCGARVCLHLGARRGETYLDPLPLLAGGRLALLPLG